jgi:hypothetical protein
MEDDFNSYYGGGDNLTINKEREEQVQLFQKNREKQDSPKQQKGEVK